jgi:hypothetical protein
MLEFNIDKSRPYKPLMDFQLSLQFKVRTGINETSQLFYQLYAAQSF